MGPESHMTLVLVRRGKESQTDRHRGDGYGGWGWRDVAVSQGMQRIAGDTRCWQGKQVLLTP